MKVKQRTNKKNKKEGKSDVYITQIGITVHIGFQFFEKKKKKVKYEGSKAGMHKVIIIIIFIAMVTFFLLVNLNITMLGLISDYIYITDFNEILNILPSANQI